MPVTAAIATFLGAIRPVGEILPIDFIDDVPAAIAAGAHRQINYDFEIESNYILSGIEVTKTVAALPAVDVLNVIVFKYPNTTDDDNDLVEIGHVGFAAGALLGTKLIAGVLSTGSGAVAPVTIPPIIATTGIFCGLGSVAADPLVKVVANQATAGSSNSSQKIRVQIDVYNGDIEGESTPDASVFILCDFIRFTDVKLVGSEELTTINA